MIVRKLRLERGWSQEQLAELSGLSVRTIQRIERGRTPSLETIKSLAAAFDLEISDLQMETGMNTENETLTAEEERALVYVRDIKGFYTHLIIYAVVIVLLLALNLVRSPSKLWVIWPAVGWGIGVAFHGLNVFEVFNLFGPEWEKRKLAKRLRRNQ